MKNTKLIEVWGKLTLKEVKKLEQYLCSPYFGNNQMANNLFFILKEYYPEFEAAKVHRENIFKQLFHQTPFNDLKLRHVASDLTKLMESFIVQQEFNKNPYHQKQLLLQFYNERNLDKHFSQNISNAQKLIDKHPYQDTRYYYNQTLINEKDYEFTATRDNRAIDTSLQQLVDHIDIHYLSNKLKYSCEIINRMNVLSVEYNIAFLDFIINYLKENPQKDIPAIHIYYTILLTLKESEEEQHYFELKRLLKENLSNFSQIELKDMFAFLQNYCIKQANQGKSAYLQELFEAYQLQLEHGILYDNNILSQFDFKNIITVALRLEAYAWTKNFITDNKPHLRSDFRINAYTYNMARVHFSQQEYKQALRLLLSVEFTDVYYHLDSKSLLLKTYYELEDFEPLLSLINTFKVYLKRNKLISDYQKTIYNNLLKFVRKLTRIKMGSKKSVADVQQEMEGVKQIADTTWLKQKIKELAA